jgi:hypothetical protein
MQSMRTPMENLFANVGLLLRIWGHTGRSLADAV